MTREEIIANKADLSGADLSRADLSDADLSKADLSRADLSDANLSDAYLRGANLSNAYLRCANLSNADLRSADLSKADLRGANLRGASLRGANLSNANLRGADLSDADLSDANITGACYSSMALFRINWLGLSDDLTLELMRHDAEFVGNEAMALWVETGECPYTGKERDFYFEEQRSLWSPGQPQLRGAALLKALCAEKNITL